MTIVPVHWPRPGLPPRKVMAEVVPATVSGGRAITAVEQVVSFDAGFWNIILDEIPLASPTQKREWRAIAAQLGGRLGLCDVPIYDTDGAPWPIIGGKPYKRVPPIPHSDGSYFSDGSGYGQPVIIATVTTTSPAGSIQVGLSVLNASQIVPGMHFSVLAPSTGLTHLYRIKTIASFTPGNPHVSPTIPDTYMVNLNLPLRAAIAANTQAEFDDPRCTCRLETDREMDTGIDDFAGRTLGRVSFVEALNV